MNSTHFPLLFLIDLDNTLIYTDEANNLAYEGAINKVLPFPESYFLLNDIKSRYPRITRACLMNYNLDKEIIDNIISVKECEYKCLLSLTRSNFKNIEKWIYHICEAYDTPISNAIKIIVTNSQEERANLTLNYHNLDNVFSQVICYNGKSTKFDYALTKLGSYLNNHSITLQNVFVFDDDINQINNIVEHKVPKKNCYHYIGENYA